jgi:hypothetical protein
MAEKPPINYNHNTFNMNILVLNDGAGRAGAVLNSNPAQIRGERLRVCICHSGEEALDYLPAHASGWSDSVRQ